MMAHDGGCIAGHRPHFPYTKYMLWVEGFEQHTVADSAAAILAFMLYEELTFFFTYTTCLINYFYNYNENEIYLIPY